MKITEDKNSGGHIITGYGKGFISVNEVTYQQSLIITPEKLVTDWAASNPKDLTLKNLLQLKNWQPEIVIIGTGEKQIFLESEIMFWFSSQGMGFEVMDSAAACRTYSILMSENRTVVAALLPP